jgi:hypothetical protein
MTGVVRRAAAVGSRLAQRPAQPAVGVTIFSGGYEGSNDTLRPPRPEKWWGPAGLDAASDG